MKNKQWIPKLENFSEEHGKFVCHQQRENRHKFCKTNDLLNHVITAFWIPHQALSVNETNIYSMEQKSKTNEQGNSL
jgi:hypothetical protein